MPTAHNNAPDGAFARTVLMPGDPLRAQYLAENFLENPQLVNTVRNCFGYTGTYKGVRVSVMASGMGIPSIGIYSYELYKFYGVENIIRIGSAGSYTKRLDVHDVILADSSYSDSSYALRQNGYTGHVHYPDKELNDLILEKARDLDIECKVCCVHSTDTFYTAPESESFVDILKRTGSECVEMESFSLFHNAKFLGKRAATLLTLSDSLMTGEELCPEDRQKSFRMMMLLALETAVALG